MQVEDALVVVCRCRCERSDRGADRGALPRSRPPREAAARRRLLRDDGSGTAQPEAQGFFTDTDIAACFAALDPHDTGKSLGVEAPKEPLEEGAEVVAKDDFMARMARELAPPLTA